MKKIRPILSLWLCLALLFSACGTQVPPTDSAPVPESSAPAAESWVTLPEIDIFRPAQTETPAVPETTVPPTTEEPEPETEPETTREPEIDEEARKAYEAAVWEGAYEMEGSFVLTRTVGDAVITVSDTLQLRVQDGSGEHTAAEGSLVRTVSGAGPEAEHSYTLSFAEGIAQIARDGLLFEAETSAEAFLSLLLPQKLFDPEKYYIVRFGEAADTVCFEDARDTETTWLGMECTDVTAGSGTARLDEAGRLISQEYSAEYALEGVQLRAEATLTVTEGEASEPAEAAERPEGRSVGDLRTVLLSDLAADMLQTENLSATLLRLVSSALAARAVMQQGWTGIGGDSLLRDDLQQVAYNGFNTSSSSREALYRDGKWTVIQDGKKTVREKDGAAEATRLRVGVTDLFPETETFVSAKLTDADDCFLIEAQLDEAFGEGLRAAAENTLFSQDDYLEAYGEYEGGSSTVIFSVDKGTGMPVHLELRFSGQHSVRNKPYELNDFYEFNYTPANADIRAFILDEPAETDAPEKQATPLMYQVTGPSGGKLWLLGTIHAGDARTAHLPQAVYDALRGSQALAVEIDITAMEEKLDSDQKLLDAYLEATYYTDGTTLYDHIEDEELKKTVEEAIHKYGGSFLAELNQCRVMTLQTLMDQTFLEMGRSLSYDRGVDTQLIRLARGWNLPVRDIEDYQNHISFTGKFSDALQELILKETLEAGRYGSNLSTQQLYELWCAGNERALRRALAEEESDEDLTEEEKALAEEYENAMMTLRNGEMLTKAKEYLSKGETVFFAVGLAHLLGEDGLVNALRAEGYTVEKVSYSE